jgi:hypothetical protein
MNAPIMLNTYGMPAMNPISPIVHQNMMHPPQNGAAAVITNSIPNYKIYNNSNYRPELTGRPLYNNTNTSIRRTKSGYVSKTRMPKRAEVNFQKACPGCYKQWRYCKCSNIKNRPDPKPYEKFIPPRMQRKQSNLN